jgi:hypothetical protein
MIPAPLYNSASEEWPTPPALFARLKAAGRPLAPGEKGRAAKAAALF